MAQDLLTKESPEIIRFFQDIEYLTRFLDSEQDRYRPVLNGERYITEAELAELLKKEGFKVTQATVSRDIRDLKLTKVQTEKGKQKYQAIEKAARRTRSPREFTLSRLPSPV